MPRRIEGGGEAKLPKKVIERMKRAKTLEDLVHSKAYFRRVEKGRKAYP